MVLIVLDSVGIGAMPDAARFGDAGRDTLGHVAASRPLKLPTLVRLGLANIKPLAHLEPPAQPAGAYGRAAIASNGKDTTTGHWEMAGLYQEHPFPTYPNGFPPDVIEKFEAAIGRQVLGNKPASGTEIIQELGEEHLRTGKPIVYTSADSVFQIAAHEEVVPVDELYRLCRIARSLLRGEHAVGRVIARPFVGDDAASFVRTERRRDFPLPPPGPTVLDRLLAAGRTTHGIGKIHDIFAGRGLSTWEKAADNAAGIAATLEALRAGRTDFVLTNLVDFDSLYGHRNDPEGYAGALEELDRRIPALLRALGQRDAIIFTADHGNDPTFPGTDHTRECAPLLVAGRTVEPVDLGTGEFADVGRTVLDSFGIETEGPGRSFLRRILSGSS